LGFSKPMSILRVYRKAPLLVSAIKFASIALLTLLLTTTGISSVVGQISLFSESVENRSYQTPWWDPNKAQRCGRLVCSDIYFSRNNQFTVASTIDTDREEAISALEVEKRAKLVQETVSSIFQQAVNSRKIQTKESLAPTGRFDLTYLLLDGDKVLHPLTPKIEVGIKNNQTVVYVPAQPELGLSQQAIVTVTEADSIADGQLISPLAQEWRDTIRRSLSESLWGFDLDSKYPLSRLLIATAIAIGMLGALWGIRGAKRILKSPERKCSKQLQELKQSLTLNPESRCSKQEKGAAVDSKSSSIENQQLVMDELHLTADSQSTQAEQETQAQLLSLKSEGAISHLLGIATQLIGNISTELPFSSQKRWHSVEAQQAISLQLPTFLLHLPKVSLQWQIMLKQQRNLIHFFLRLLFWGQVFILLWGVGLILEVYPATRSYASFFLSHAFWLPLLWMLLSLTDKVTNVLIDHYLNQWAQDAYDTNPISQRYTLRVSTYSPALKGASTSIFSALGIYLAVQSFGMSAHFLASAGVAAAILAFLSRNLLEDMLNGALILWTDRYAVGDVIKVGEPMGLVEDMNLYITQVRTLDGRLLTIPNGKIGIVENLTKEWSRADFQIEIAYDADVKLALEVIRQTAEKMRSDPQWQDKILESASILGVENLSHAGTKIRVLLKTQAMEKWTVEREFRFRVKQAFDEAHIAIGVPQQEIWHHNAFPVSQTNSNQNTEENLSSSE
jgi:small-conductance mechanosensitive channel